MKMTKSEFFKWANEQKQWTENEMLSPHNRDIADSEIVDVISWQRFASIINRLIDGAIEIDNED